MIDFVLQSMRDHWFYMLFMAVSLTWIVRRSVARMRREQLLVLKWIVQYPRAYAEGRPMLPIALEPAVMRTSFPRIAAHTDALREMGLIDVDYNTGFFPTEAGIAHHVRHNLPDNV